jgi:hypothetical protein
MQLRVKEKAEQLAVLYSDAGRPPPPRDLQALHRRLSTAADAGDFSSISTQDRREAVWCLWMRYPGEAPLGDKLSFWGTYVHWIERRQRPSDYRNLVLSWLQGFDYQNPAVNAARAIQRACEKWPDWPWAKRHREWQVFDVQAGPAELASLVMEARMPVAEVLKIEGFSEWLQTGGYVEAAYVEMLQELPKRLTTAVSDSLTLVAIERAIQWSAADGDRLRYPSQKVLLAEALLLPWHHAGSMPPSGSQKSIQSFLLQYIGDPRLNPGAWFGVSDTAIHVLKRWLIGASLEVFIKIIEQVAESGHWRYRKAFWMSYFKRDYIADAWIVLGRNAQHLARTFDDLRGNYGKLDRGSVLANHSVLLMKIGDLIIADWSHSGTCRIWRRDDPMAPPYYQPEYSGNSLRTVAVDEIPHYGSKYGNWQRRVVTAIHDKTGISVPSGEYMP